MVDDTIQEDIASDVELDDEPIFLEPDEGDQLSCIVERLLLTPKTDSFPQRHSLFKTPCTINGKICTIIIDSGSTENIVSQKLVTALNLPVSPHPTPYEVTWIKKGGEVQVNNICSVPPSIGNNYKDQIVCDVLDMDVCHILLGRPWQYDTQSVHKGRDNTYEFLWMGKKIVLLPLGTGSNQNTSPCKTKGQLFTITSDKQLLRENASHILGLVIKDYGMHDIPSDIPPEIQELFTKFPSILETPTTLPPLRDIQHNLDLIPGATLPNLPHY